METLIQFFNHKLLLAFLEVHTEVRGRPHRHVGVQFRLWRWLLLRVVTIALLGSLTRLTDLDLLVHHDVVQYLFNLLDLILRNVKLCSVHLLLLCLFDSLSDCRKLGIVYDEPPLF